MPTPRATPNTRSMTPAPPSASGWRQPRAGPGPRAAAAGGAQAVERGEGRRGLLLVTGPQARVVLVGDVTRPVLELELTDRAERRALVLLQLFAGLDGQGQEGPRAVAAPPAGR